MTDTIFFDLDDTLLDFKKAEAQAIRRTLKKLDLDSGPEIAARYSAINQSQWELLEKGELTRHQVLHRRFELLFAELGVDRSSREAQRIYEELLSQGHDYLPGAEALLRTLAPSYRLYLVSNGTAAVQDRRLRDSGIGQYFQGVFISERVGCDKPAKGFFDRCFAAIPNFSPENAVIVGDSLTSDIQGGNNAGLRTCWYNPQGRPRRPGIRVDWEISALDQLPALLKAEEALV